MSEFSAGMFSIVLIVAAFMTSCSEPSAEDVTGTDPTFISD